mgnify:CR=1 FL=1
MENRYEEGSSEWDLLEAAEEISAHPAPGDKTAEAIDRLTIALYRIGAALSYSLRYTGDQIGAVAEEIRDKQLGD